MADVPVDGQQKKKREKDPGSGHCRIAILHFADKQINQKVVCPSGWASGLRGALFVCVREVDSFTVSGFDAAPSPPIVAAYSRSYLTMTVFSASIITVLVTGAPVVGTTLTS